MTPCWIWLKSKSQGGYGRLKRKGLRSTAVHRIVWEEFYGKVPEKMELHHLCANKLCYNPEHLQVVSRRAHTIIERGIPTVCKEGHELTPENTRLHCRNDRPGPHRGCRICYNKRKGVWVRNNLDKHRANIARYRAKLKKFGVSKLGA